MNAEENLLLLQRIDADRQFLLLALQGNPELLARQDVRLRELFAAVPPAGRPSGRKRPEEAAPTFAEPPGKP